MENTKREETKKKLKAIESHYDVKRATRAMAASYMLHYCTHMLVEFELNPQFKARNKDEEDFIQYLFTCTKSPFKMADGEVCYVEPKNQ